MYSFNRGFKRARKQLGLTQQEFADKYYFSLPTVKKWEQGQAIPEYNKLFELCEIFNCDLDYLFAENELPTRDLQYIHDQTGLSSNSIHSLRNLFDENKVNWGMDIFNAIIEHDKFPLFLGLIAELATLKDSSEKLTVANHSSIVYSGSMTVHDVLQYRIQTLLFEIVRDITPKFESKSDDRFLYDFVFSAYKEGKITKEEYEHYCKKLDNGDYSEFQAEANRND